MVLKQRQGIYPKNIARRIGFFRAFVSGRPVWCSWQITDRCNFRCKFCHVWKQPKSREQSLSDIRRSAENLARIGSMVVSMTGGEALLRKDLPEIIRAVDRYHFTFISTNGSLITRENARALAEAGLWGVGVSLDYADPQRHDAARGYPGAFNRAVEALKILQASRIRKRPQVNMMITLMHDNLEDVYKLADLAAKIGCNFRVQPYSAIKTGDTRLIHPAPVAEKLLELYKRYPNFATSPVVIEKFDQALKDGVDGCVAGRYMLNIDPRGNVAKCPEDQANPVGHILEDDTETLLSRLKESHRLNTCRDCWYNCRSELEMSYTLRGMFYAGLRNILKR